MEENKDFFKELNLTFDTSESVNSDSKEDKAEEKTITFNKNFETDSEVPLVEELDNSEKPKKSKKKKKKSKKIGVLIWILSIIIVSIALAFAFLIGFVDITGILGTSSKKEITIPQGASTAQIAEILKEENLIKSDILFRAFSKLKKSDGLYQYGTYYISQDMGYEGMIRELQTIGTIAPQVEVTIPERANIKDIAKILQKSNVCTETEFITAMKTCKFDYDFVDDIPKQSVYYFLEGYLFPDTYYFFEKEGDNGVQNAERAINKMLERFDEQIPYELRKTADDSGYSFHEVMTLASIVELEASAQNSQMPKVAQVFYNRLNKWEVPKLQSDPTTEYVSSRYNTYNYEGLPPGPLCSPSFNAIKAALKPDKSLTAFYFVTDIDMKFYYSDTLSEHSNTISSLKNQGKWA